MPESISALWRNASPLKRLLLAGVPAVVVALGAGGVIYAAFSGGGTSKANQQVLAATQSPATPTTAAATATKAPAPTSTPTAPPVNAGLQNSGGGAGSSSANGGPADPAPVYQAPSADLSGPGPELGTAWTLVIPAIGVNASVYSRTIGGDGQMGNPSGPWDVVWYDFAAEGWAGLGGAPGQAGANAVMAGHVDYCCPSPTTAVFWSIRDLNPGDIVTVNTEAGPINYSVQWGQWAAPDQDFTGFVSQTGQESLTLVTCIGSFSGGHYSNRYVVRAVRA
jgi:LPXTG-site transpeptidase (sortase) family protein